MYVCHTVVDDAAVKERKNGSVSGNRIENTIREKTEYDRSQKKKAAKSVEKVILSLYRSNLCFSD